MAASRSAVWAVRSSVMAAILACALLAQAWSLRADRSTDDAVYVALADESHPPINGQIRVGAASPEKSPCSRIRSAALMSALIAAQANAPPTLIRRAPAAAISATVSPSGRASTLTGFDTAWHTARISAAEASPGA